MRLTSRLLLSLSYRLPKFEFGFGFSEMLLDHIPPSVYFDKSEVQPFNGQAQGWGTIYVIARLFKGTHAIETGTYLGSSTSYISSLVTDITHTIEINPETIKKTQKRFRLNHSIRKINLIQGDSAQEIRKVLKGIDPSTSRVIAYLGVHWLDEIPTTEEILALMEWGGPGLAIIDDFKVPSGDGYGFDQYGDVIIGPAIVPISADVYTYVPSGPLNLEIGKTRRGTGYVFNTAARKIVDPDSIHELFRLSNHFNFETK